ncbi:beta strand repeat-containing protein [Fontimonas thermophila]|uniref:beta strand repeat-containing protein n=1 Tax=Fontimonas thermophila TaxID=1076937 RepID=UPI0022865CCE|nr:Ig-like domain-containing protein [Fontimonas thermophila]
MAVAALFALLLSACGGGATLGSGQTTGGTLGGTTGGGTTGGSTGGSTGGPPALVELTPAQTAILADGSSTVLLTATLVDDQGNPIAGERLDFSATAGTLRDVGNTANATFAMTDTQGRARLRLRSTTLVTQSTVTVRHATGLSANTTVRFTSGPVANLVDFVVSPDVLAPGGVASVGLRALDAQGNPVSDELIQFDVPSNASGGRFEHTLVATDANGFAQVRYFAGASPGTDTLRARAGSGTGTLVVTRSVAINVGVAQVGSLTLQTGASRIVADGLSTVALRATVRDLNGNPVVNQAVGFTASAGTLSASSATTNASGVAEVRLTSSTVAQSVVVRAFTGGFEQTADLEFAAGTPSALTLALAPSSITPNGSSTVRATVQDANGNRISGVTVRFSNANATLGGLSQQTAQTDGAGEASVVYTALSQTGTDTVSASLPQFGAVSPVSGNVVIDASAAVITGLTLSAGSAQVAPGGTVVIRATVTTSSGQIAGKTVAFSTSALGASLSASTATTNGRGEAEVTLTAPTDPGVVTVRAAIGGFNATVDVQVGAGVPSLLDLFVADAPTMPYNTATTVRATVLDANRNPVPGVLVLFDVPVNGSRGTLASAQVTTDANGRATTSYTTGPATGSATTDRLQVRVANTSLVSSINLSVVPQLGSLTLSAAQPTLVADGSAQTVVRAVVRDTSGAPVRNADVRLRSSAGTLTPSAGTPVPTNAQGEASFTLTAGSIAGEAVLQADVTGGLSATTVVQFVPGAPATLDVQALPGVVNVGGQATVRSRLRDANGNPVPGVQVQFLLPSASSSSLSPAVVETDANGEAAATYTHRGSAGTESITVRSASLSQNVALTANAQAQRVASLILDLGSSSVPAGGDDVTVRATVLDTAGAPVAGLTVGFTATRGTLSAASALTDSDGVAEVRLTPPTDIGSVTLAAVASGFRAEATLSVVPGPADAAQSIIAADPAAILADGNSTSQITVVLNDAFGNPLADGTPVQLTTTRGQLLNTVSTLASGRATFTLRSTPGTGTATVRVVGVPGLSVPVAFESASAGDPASIRFSVVQTRISVAGVGQTDQTQITVTVLDSSGNPIDESRYGNSALNNLRAQLVSRPDGGESLTGTDASSTVVSNDASGIVDVRTRNGTAILTLRAGTLPGVVQVRFSVLEFTGTDFNVPADVAAVAALPQVSIAGGPPHTISFTQPITDAIEDLNNGNYRLKGKVDVTDRYGNSVPDGTVVNLSLIDSVIVHDITGATTANGSTLARSGNSLIRRRCTSEPTPGGEASGCGARGALTGASDFTSPITRNDVPRFIQAGDIVAIRNAQSADKRRFVSSVGGATQLTVQTPYLNTLNNGEFWVGASAMGAQIAGLASNGDLTPGTGVTKDGIAEFRVTYPANPRTILSGCYGYPYPDRSYDDRDRRDSVPQSRQVIVVANSGPVATGINAGDYCFKAIAGSSLTPLPSEIALGLGGSAVVGLELRDGGDRIPLPYVGLSCFVSALGDDALDPGTFGVTVAVNTNSDGFQETDVDGRGSVTITSSGTGAKGTATITCLGADTTATITVQGI